MKDADQAHRPAQRRMRRRAIGPLDELRIFSSHLLSIFKLHRDQREKNRRALSFRILAFVVGLKSLRSWNFCKELGWLSECGISEPSMIRSSPINLSGSRRWSFFFRIID